MPENNHEIVRAGYLAELLGLSTKRLQDLSRKLVDDEPVCLRVSSGKYDLQASIQGYVKFLKTAIETGAAPAQRRIMAQAESAEIDLALKRGEVVHIDDVLDTITIIVSNVQTRLLGCPNEIAEQIDDGMSRAERKDAAEKSIRRALSEFADAKTSFLRKASGDKKAR